MYPAALLAPSIGRRLASMLYEALLLTAVLFIASFLFLAVAHDATRPDTRPFFQGYLVTVSAAYFLWFWLHGGQTLPMKTWHLRLESKDGSPLSRKQAVLRFILALIGIGLGFGLIWALFDKNRQFWHDRMAGTRIVSCTGPGVAR